MSTTTGDEKIERPKRPYEPPTIEESGDFERLVLECLHRPDDFDNEACLGGGAYS